jgi:hypothetical protein
MSLRNRHPRHREHYAEVPTADPAINRCLGCGQLVRADFPLYRGSLKVTR